VSKQDSKFFNIFSLVLGILVVITVVLFALARSVGNNTQKAHLLSDPKYVAAVETRVGSGRVAVAGQDNAALAIAPAAGVAPVAAAALPVDGPAVYETVCGACHINGIAGERFCVRNSGVKTVVEGVGDHGCEYMTGGQVIVLGATGRNFAAGMSGGVAYVYDLDGLFEKRLNKEMVNLYRLIECGDADIANVKSEIEKHVELTGSPRGKHLLANWDAELPKFFKVFPRDYERMLECFRKVEEQGLSGDEAAMAAFEENLKDLSRVGGN